MNMEIKDTESFVHTAKVFKAMCDENRLMILELLKNGEKCACVILEELNIVQSTLSHHMKILVESGLVISRKDGKWTNYVLSVSGFETARKLLNEFTEQLDSNGGNCTCK